MVAAYHLCRDHAITLFEANGYLGGHTNTVEVTVAGQRQAVDTGFIVFNDRTYPAFVRLLDELRVPSFATDMSFSVRCQQSGLEYCGSSLNGLLAQRKNLLRPAFYRLVRDILRFNRLAPRQFNGLRHDQTVDDYIASQGLSREFAEWYLLPMGSAIWSCPRTSFGRFPIRFIIEFYRHHGLLSLTDRPTWRVVEGGSRTYVERLTRPFLDRTRTNSPVVGVRRDQLGVQIIPRGQPAEVFDHVVFACHSDQALRMLGDGATPLEHEVLEAFPYQKNIAVLHTDRRMLPRSRRAWASWNYLLPTNGDDGATVTYHMNRLQHLQSSEEICVTLNGEQQIDPAKILRRFEYQHPVFTTRRQLAQARHSDLLLANRTSYCGAYWGNGFHEDGVQSGLAVCAALQGSDPCSVFSFQDSERHEPHSTAAS